MAGTRWCNNVRRSHASNGVRWTADLAAGLAWQSCWDDCCRDYRSPPVRIPLDALPHQGPS